MISQEELYALILQKDWQSIITFLHRNKEVIKTDALLSQAAQIFEVEFFRNIEDNNDAVAKEVLEYMVLLHQGKFHQFQPGNILKLITAFKQIDAKLGESYSKLLLPNSSQTNNYTPHFQEISTVMTKNISTANWIAIFNRLFVLMNNQGDVATYFSGPKFINTVREFDSYFPDYQQFINLRNEQGKSTSRKIFYYDILMDFDEGTRIKIVNRLLEMLKPFKPNETELIGQLLGGETIITETNKPVEKPKEVVETLKGKPAVFISYSWDSEEHKNWVLKLAEKLVKEGGVDVRLDRWYLNAGKSIPVFIEQAIREADRIIVVYTENYRMKADKRQGGVGFEYSILNQQVYEQDARTAGKLLPVLRQGSQKESVPDYMKQFIHIDMTNDENFEASVMDILREVYDEPAITKPEIGERPMFDKFSNGITDELLLKVIDKNGNVVDQETLK